MFYNSIVESMLYTQAAFTVLKRKPIFMLLPKILQQYNLIYFKYTNVM
jgi:hypothetical protein